MSPNALTAFALVGIILAAILLLVLKATKDLPVVLKVSWVSVAAFAVWRVYELKYFEMDPQTLLTGAVVPVVAVLAVVTFFVLKNVSSRR